MDRNYQNSENILHTNVVNGIKKYQLRDSKFLLSVSTGVDSFVMLDIFHRLELSIHVAHFNHMKREASYKEQDLLKSWCDERNIPITMIEIRPSNKGNFQNNARQERYRLLMKIATENQCDIICTAHHLDDQRETFWQRLLHGAGLSKLGSIKEFTTLDTRKSFFRPFLKIEKQTLYDYARKLNVPFQEDASNQTYDYQRNRIRHELIPMLQTYNPQIQSHVDRIIEESLLLESYINDIYRQNITELYQEVSFSYQWWKVQHIFLQHALLVEICRRQDIPAKRQNIHDWNLSITDGTKVKCQLKNRFVAYVENDIVTVKKDNCSEGHVREIDYFYPLKNNSLILPRVGALWYNVENISHNQYTDCYFLSKDEITYLDVRNMRQNDSFPIYNGHKKVRREWIDKKLPKQYRKIYPIVIDRRTQEIVWIPGIRKVRLNKYNPEYGCVYFNDINGGF